MLVHDYQGLDPARHARFTFLNQKDVLSLDQFLQVFQKLREVLVALQALQLVLVCKMQGTHW